MRHPDQHTEIDSQGIHRFRKNAVVARLLEHGEKTGMDLNRLCVDLSGDQDLEDWRQFMQLIGYSVCGFRDLRLGEDWKPSTPRRAAMIGVDAIAAAVKSVKRKGRRDQLRGHVSFALDKALRE